MKALLLCLLLMPYPGYIQSSTGEYFHLWQLPEASGWEPEESIRFEELENDLGDGYSSQVLYGAETGLRRWRIKLPTLAALSVLPSTVYDVTSTPTMTVNVSREEYVWNLFCYTKKTGRPFVYRSLRNGQFYFVRFADKELSYQKARVKLYSTGIELKQVRLPGQSVFQTYRSLDLFRPEFETPFEPDFWLKGTDTDEGGNGVGFTKHGDVIETTVNGLPVSRFNSVSNSGYMDIDDAPGQPYYDIFLLMKIRSATFPADDPPVLLDPDLGDLLLGLPTDTKFYPPPTPFEYRLNGVLYESSDMQAPMNTFGVIHIRFPAGGQFGAFRFGQLATASAHMDIAEAVAIKDQPLSDGQVNEFVEYLTVKAGQLNQ